MTEHTVQKGESLWKISKMYGVSLESLIAFNPQIQNPDVIDVGQKVNIPSGGPGYAEVPVPTLQQAEMPTETPTGTTGPQMPAPSPVSQAPIQPTAPSQSMTQTPTPSTAPSTAPSTMPSAGAAPMPEMHAYPSVPKWEGLWKYVVKNGDTLFKIAKQVGVTLDQLKAANPQVSNPDKIYPGQVLNIPSSGLKPKGNPGYSLKEQLTAPIGLPKQQLTAPIGLPKEQLTAPIGLPPVPKEILTKPKEMVTMEKPITPMPAPMPTPMMPPLDINFQWAPHKENYIQYAPHKDTNITTHINSDNAVQMQQASDPKMVAKQQASFGNPHMMQYMAPMHHPHLWHMYYLPVSYKKHKKCGCKHKKHHCGCHHHHPHHMWMHHPHYHLMMQQHMSMYPKTFYREED